MFLKEKAVKEIIGRLRNAAVAFSGGVDSTYLLKLARDVLGEGVTAYTVDAGLMPESELKAVLEFVETCGIKHTMVKTELSEVPHLIENPIDRCYHCKRHNYSLIISEMKKDGIMFLLDGSNADDAEDYRPGKRAAEELGIISPLAETGMTKADIRKASAAAGLKTWDKPAYACLASRIPYYEPITHSSLEIVEKAEKYLHDLGFAQVRVRLHNGNLARIEIEKEKLQTILFDKEISDKIAAALKGFGCKYVSLDLGGYIMGNMNNGG